jgi:hypothetical protein
MEAIFDGPVISDGIGNIFSKSFQPFILCPSKFSDMFETVGIADNRAYCGCSYIPDDLSENVPEHCRGSYLHKKCRPIESL